MGTRTKGDYGKFSRVSMNQAEARELRDALERHEPAVKIVDAALGVIGVSNNQGHKIASSVKLSRCNISFFSFSFN